MEKWLLYFSLTYSRRLTRPPHAFITSAGHALGVKRKLLNYVNALLTDRTFTVRVGGVTNALWSVSCGVPQDSVPSPFLFNLVPAPLTKCLPETAVFLVRSTVHADDVTLYVRGPTRMGSAVRTCMQEALQCVVNFVRSIGLTISAPKTKALVVHPRAEARRRHPCLQLDGALIVWLATSATSGLTIDNRLLWFSAVWRVRQTMCRAESAVRRVLVRGNGCPAAFTCTIYEAMALSTTHYELPICELQGPQWRLIYQDHRRAIRMCPECLVALVWPGHSRKLARGLRPSRWSCALCAT
ncbi:hypothetical protein MRX96_010933 [Rhipicephalus microplus]